MQRASRRPEYQAESASLARIALPAVLEQLAAPAFVLSNSGRVDDLNELARALLAREPDATLGVLARAISEAREPGVRAVRLGEAGGSTGWLVLLGALDRERDMNVRVAQLARRTGLTHRQARVLAALAEGLSNRGIAASLEVSVRTVEVHVSAVFDKVGVSSRAGVLAALLERV